MIWFVIASLIVSLYIGFRAARNVSQQSNVQSGQIEAPSSVEDTPQGIVFGDAWVPNWMVLGMGNQRTTAIKVKVGKK